MPAEGPAATASAEPGRAARVFAACAIIALPLADLWWNLAHLNIGSFDFYGPALFARGLALNGAWPATPYFPAGYPLLLLPFGWAGSVLVGGYILSALGLMLALWALYRLAREFGLSRPVALLAVILGWLMPVFRETSGNPGVDALYTGLGLCFIAAAIAAWRADGTLPRWAQMGLLVPALALPLLRYHAVILLAPVLLLLWLARRRHRPLLLAASFALLGLIAFNYYSWHLAYGSVLPGVAQIQVRCGLEYDNWIAYAGHDELFADYPAFCDHARSHSLLQDYSAPVIARHVMKSWLYFLRRPAVALALALSLLALVLRRRELPRGALIGALWMAGYTLALSPAYYTPRAAVLPALAGVALSLALAHALAGARWGRAVPALAAVLLLAGYGVSSRYALAMYAERAHFAQLSRQVEAFVRNAELMRDEVVVGDSRVVPLRDNPWCAPYPMLDRSWLGDPEIRAEQVPGLVDYPPRELASNSAVLSRVGLLMLSPLHPATEEAREVAHSKLWEQVEEIEEITVLAPRVQTPGESARDAGAVAETR